MKEVVINVVDKKVKKVLQTHHISFPENWSEVTVEQVSKFMNCTKTYRDGKEQLKKMPLDGQPYESKMMDIIFTADMICCLTGADKDLIYSFNEDEILELASNLDFIKTPPQVKPLKSIVFRKYTLAQINDLNKKLENTSIARNPIKYAKIKAELEAGLNIMYEVKEVEKLSLMQWIKATDIGKEVNKISKEMKQNDFSRMAELLSYVLLEKGKSFSMKRQRKNRKVFNELPFDKAYSISNFFLSMQTTLLKGIKTFIVTKTEAKKMNLKQKQKENI